MFGFNPKVCVLFYIHCLCSASPQWSTYGFTSMVYIRLHLNGRQVALLQLSMFGLTSMVDKCFTSMAYILLNTNGLQVDLLQHVLLYLNSLHVALLQLSMYVSNLQPASSSYRGRQNMADVWIRSIPSRPCDIFSSLYYGPSDIPRNDIVGRLRVQQRGALICRKR